ncbi:nitrous oxide reductase family maturation protein NosD [Cyclobacterium jeungdonense]|uniref:Nitrous oxide reductase family maturation protein NosD n=1 Tax=Cyclobacterium jeungdonense TaxID=708087 RepID=A0ABT8C7I9_9BACT|nr:nitrous oxide reductase family maturation protein NosD [Cyclobacterium jeungdonense]MDN3688735.1 nitrous oxide reductase family maturation protein NosD [Cyclobacterium jeungdonense]
MSSWIPIILSLLTLLPSWGNAKTIALYPGEGRVISDAILQAAPYDTLVFKKGIYQENSILVDKPLVLLGEEGAIVDGQMGDEIFVIVSDDVSLENLTLKNVGVSYLKDRAAIRLNRVSNVTIRNNRLLNTFFGIYLQKSNECVVDGNTITGAAEEESRAGNAIHIWQGKRIRVTHNTLSHHRDGIYFEFVDESYIAFNQSRNNMRYGLHFMFSNDDIYENNVFQNNGSGVAVMFSNRISMENNEFLDNWGGASYGLLLKEISDGTIRGNRFQSNTVGIYAEGANRLVLSQNLLQNNGKAMDIKGNCMDNRILDNNFIGNTFEVLTNSKTNLNHFEGNYWSQYSGYDLNKDGVGDLPHRPVNLFALITDKVPAAHMLLHSFLVSSLEVAERMFPQFIPEQLIDSQPQISPYPYDYD